MEGFEECNILDSSSAVVWNLNWLLQGIVRNKDGNHLELVLLDIPKQMECCHEEP